MSVKWDPRDYGDPTLEELLRMAPRALVGFLLVVAFIVATLIVGAGLDAVPA